MILKTTYIFALSLFLLFLLPAPTLAPKVIHCQNQTQQNPFLKLQYDKVVSYQVPDKFSVLSIVEEDYTLNKHVPTNKGKVLSAQEINALLNIVLDEKSYGGGAAACFDPHWGVVFYKKGKIVGSIEVCFGCNTLETRPFQLKIAEEYTDKLMNCNSGEDCGKYIFGFSKEGRKKLKSLGAKWGINSYDLVSESSFD
ncbi:hypothetical protein [Hugenholtzia roseola]|uniref:hypothetical protein n=1 Tax=Hugenholtzia roseola TaxID=1002 RepID=UPI00047BF30C|nr:hypothetical protein [Hugenholtzia roseola]